MQFPFPARRLSVCRQGRLAALLCLLAVLVPSGPAAAQSFFEKLFGFNTTKPAVSLTVPQTTRPRGVAPANPYGAVREKNDDGARASGGGSTFRTVCVRMCDGYFIPMSFATHRDGFYQDEMKCHASCGGEARLFFHPNAAGTSNSGMQEAVDLSGRPYSRLANAFRYQKSVVQGCACRPPPWTETEVARHQSYAVAAAAVAARATPMASTAGGAGQKVASPGAEATAIDEPQTPPRKAGKASRKGAQQTADVAAEGPAADARPSRKKQTASQRRPDNQSAARASARSGPRTGQQVAQSNGGLFGLGLFGMGLGGQPK